MKTINTFLIEKLKINSNSRKYQMKYDYDIDEVDKFEITLPKVDDPFDEKIDYSKKWKTFELPKHNLLIVKDKYRNDHPHLVDICDLIASMIALEDDYENFNIKDDIIYSGDNIKEIVEYYFVKILGIDKNDLPKDPDDIDSWTNHYDDKVRYKMCDNLYSLAEFYLGMDSFYDDVDKNKDINFNDPQKFLENIVKHSF